MIGLGQESGGGDPYLEALAAQDRGVAAARATFNEMARGGSFGADLTCSRVLAEGGGGDLLGIEVVPAGDADRAIEIFPAGRASWVTRDASATAFARKAEGARSRTVTATEAASWLRVSDADLETVARASSVALDAGHAASDGSSNTDPGSDLERGLVERSRASFPQVSSPSQATRDGASEFLAVGRTARAKGAEKAVHER